MKKWGLFVVLIVFVIAINPVFSEDVLTIKEAVQQALLKSEKLQIEEADIHIVEAQYRQLRSAVFPSISFNASELVQDRSTDSVSGSPVSNSFTRRSRPEASFNLTQPIFSGFREFYAMKAMHAEKEKNKLLLDRAREQFMADVIQSYYMVLEQEDEVRIKKQILNTIRQREKEIHGWIHVGKSREIDVVSLEAEKARLEADLAHTEGQVQSAREVLSFLVGERVTKPLKDEFVVPRSIPSSDHYIALAQERHDLSAQSKNIQSAQKQVAYEKGSIFPKVNASANYYPYRVGLQSDIDWDVQFNLNFPIFQGGLRKGKIDEAKLRLKQAQLQKTEFERLTEREVRQAHDEFLAQLKMETKLRDASQKSRKNYELYLQDEKLGLVSSLDVLTAMKDYLQLELEASRSGYVSKLRYLSLKLSAGDLTLSTEKRGLEGAAH